MRILNRVLVVTTVASMAFSQGLAPTDSWPTYNGDYSGRRFSPLTQINDADISSLSLAWVYRLGSAVPGSAGSIKATPLMVNGVLYFTIPDHV